MHYRLIRSSTGQIFHETADYDRIATLCEKYEARDIFCEIHEIDDEDNDGGIRCAQETSNAGSD